ncbi:phosphoribosylanthranilate isomerase [Hahella aquimaris]|uniref:phosphoribosylanthranilate isomerase n=1 Tax=Hahella sp. HNIBRBA332 TaxID=3015983 RepID=UPI00273B6C1A|nr:phosphoribosylanthranilate isomerase [Hahella sp. HNIBRBA332]WLQ15493.1 phosphoribosylanthranilate isomerase [Hahella sp. HNIBRBA332]
MNARNKRVRCKICGILELEHALAVSDAGGDAIGFVFYPPSPRYIDPVAASRIIAKLPPFITTVGLFVNHDAEQVREILNVVPLDVLQFHGDEDNDFCRSFSRPFYKAIGVGEETDVVAEAARYPDAAALLFDTHDPQLRGGTGRVFDWSRIRHELGKPVILAGGLNPTNVAEAIRTVRPYAVDVSGGVEASKGVKSIELIQEFIGEVYREYEV